MAMSVAVQRVRVDPVRLWQEPQGGLVGWWVSRTSNRIRDRLRGGFQQGQVRASDTRCIADDGGRQGSGQDSGAAGSGI